MDIHNANIPAKELIKLYDELERENKSLEEENRKQKLHIEAKDKAFMDLLKDYEDLKKERDEMKAEIRQRLDAFRNRYLGF